MKEQTVDIELWDKYVGTIAWDMEKKVASFQYDEKFIRSNLDISPFIMPLNRSSNRVYQFLQNRNNCFNGLPGLVADSLPDTFGSQMETLACV